jgi:hypothetical protein
MSEESKNKGEVFIERNVDPNYKGAPVERVLNGTFIHDEEAWCPVCVKTTIWYALMHDLSADGVTVCGTVRGCHICKDWVRKDLNGKILTILDNAKENS